MNLTGLLVMRCGSARMWGDRKKGGAVTSRDQSSQYNELSPTKLRFSYLHIITVLGILQLIDSVCELLEMFQTPKTPNGHFFRHF